jgi:hypothetical protein
VASCTNSNVRVRRKREKAGPERLPVPFEVLVASAAPACAQPSRNET